MDTALLDRMRHPKSVRFLDTRVTEVALHFGTVDRTILEWGHQQVEAGVPGPLNKRPDCPPDMRRVLDAVERCWKALYDLGGAKINSQGDGHVLHVGRDDGDCWTTFEFECPDGEVFENRRAVVEAARPDAEAKFKIVRRGICLNYELH